MILDTTFIIDIMQNDTDAIKKLNDLHVHGIQKKVTALSIFELFSGLSRCAKPQREANKIMTILEGQTIIGLNQDAAEKSGIIDGQLSRKGQQIGVIDVLISGIALSNNEKILTRNKKDFERIPGLTVETY